MPETLRDLVVTLSLNADNFSRNITSINAQIREAESQFRLAGAGVQNFGSTTDGMTSRLSMLQSTLGYQRNAVGQYERMLAQANTRLHESYSRQEQYTQKLEAARTKHEQLAQSIQTHEASLQELRDLGMEGTSVYAEEEAALERLKAEYNENGQEIQRLEGQVTSLQRTTQNAANGVSRAQTNLNNARAAVRETEAEIERLNARLRTAQSAWTAFGSALTALSGKMTAFGQAASTVGKRMTMMVTLPIVKAGKEIIKSSLDFESSFALVRKTVDGTEEDYDRLAEASKRMSTEIATSTTDINKVMATGGQLGIRTEHIESFTRSMIDLEKASTDLDAETAATQLAKFANIMGSSQGDFDRMGSTVAQLGNNFATTEAPIVDMAMRIAGAGKQAGLTEPQVLGLATALSSVGIQAQAGGSSISKALINMEVATVEGGQALEDFARISGMTEQEFIEHWKSDPVDTFQRFISGVAQLDEEGVSAIQTLNDMGISEIRLRDTLLRSVNASELFARAQTMAQEAWEKNTALQEKSAERYKTLESRLTNVKNKAVLFAQTLGDDLRPTIEKVMQGVSDFIDRLQDLDAGQRLDILKFTGIAAAAGPVLLIVGKLSTGLGKVIGVIGKFCTSVGAAGGGFSGLLSVLAGSPAVWFAVGAAVAYGIKQFSDWVSGATAAREAQEQLNETVREWGENAVTAYEQSRGLEKFGLSREDFSVGNETDASSWLEQAIQTWKDGKQETDEIVNETVSGFTEGTDKIRESLEGLREAGGSGGGTLGDLDADIKRLDEIDAEVESIFKKRQNGFLTEDDTARLQELIDERGAIQVKYQLVSDTNSGFDQIVVSAEAALSRGADAGNVWADVYAAASQGLDAYIESLNAEYDAQYKTIQAMEDGAEKDAALKELQTGYQEKLNAAQLKYGETLSQVAQETGAFDEGGKYDSTLDKLGEVQTAMEELAAADTDEEKAAALQKLNTALEGLDETNLIEVTAALTSMGNAGVDMDERMQGALGTISSMKELLTGGEDLFGDSYESLNALFGEGLDTEVLEINATLNTESLDASYTAWASSGALTPIVPTIDTSSMDPVQIDIQGNITEVLAAEGATFTVDANGNITEVTWPEGSTYTVDAEGNITSVTTPDGSVYTVDAQGNITSITTIDGNTFTVDGKGNVTGVALADGVSFTVDGNGKITAVNPAANLTFEVDGDGRVVHTELADSATFEVDGEGNVTNVVVQDGVTYVVDGKGNVTSVTTADGISYSIDGKGIVTSVTTADGITYSVDGTGVLTAVALSPDVVIPEISLTASVSELTLDENTKFNTAKGAGLDASFSKSSEIINTTPASPIMNKITPGDADAVSRYADAVRKFNSAAENGQDVTEAWTDLNMALPAGSASFREWTQVGTRAADTAQYISTGLQKVADGTITQEDATELKAYMTNLSEIGEFDPNALTTLSDAFGEMDTVGGTVFEDIDPSGLANVLQTAADQIDPSAFANAGEAAATAATDAMGNVDASASGQNVVDGFTTTVAAGAGEAGDAGETVGTAGVDGVDTGAETQSPSRRTMETGRNVVAGLVEGMQDTSTVTEAGTALGQAVTDAISTALTPDMFSGPGQSAMEGLAAGMQTADLSTAGAAVGAALQSAVSTGLTGDSLSAVGQTAAQGLANGISSADMSGVASTLSNNLVVAMGSALTPGILQPYGETAGNDVATGISTADMSGAASTLGTNVIGAVGASLTAGTLQTIGATAANGLAAGLTSKNFSSVGSSVASRVRSALSGSLNSSTLSSIGANAMQGLASGISSGSASVVGAIRAAAQAAVAAAKAELQIHSPSRVFRDEVGAMTMRGFGEGVERESRHQAEIIANAARYLTTAAQESAMGMSTDNRRTYNNQSSVNLTGNTFIIRNEDDARNLAVQIANLTKKQQAGYGGSSSTALSG